MDYDKEINRLAAETLALQTLLVALLSRLDPNAVATTFDDAANFLENLAIKFGRAASPDHVVKALEIVERLRANTLSNHEKPTHGI